MSEPVSVAAAELPGAQAAPPLVNAGPLHLAGRALLLDEAAYLEIVQRTRPSQQGLVALLWILGIVLLSRLVGFGLNWQTSPRLERIETLLRDFVMGLPWYSEQVRQIPDFATQFAQNYWLTWEGLRSLLGIYTPANTALWTGATVLDTLLAWLLFGLLAHVVARWLGGTGRFSQTLGALALAYAPLLLVTIELVPGARLPLGLLFLLMLIGKYQALKTAHRLTPGYALAAALLPYLLGSLLLLAAILFGSAYGLEQIPYYDEFITTLRTGAGLWSLR